MNRIRFAKKLGLKIKVYDHDRTWSLYDGKIVHISSANHERDIDHEMGHFIAATKRERTKPEWGLERGPDYPNDEILKEFKLPDLVIRPNYSDRTTKEDKRQAKKESTASLFGIAVTYLIGAKDEWRAHADSHQWDRSGTACDLYCLIADTEHFDLKTRLTKALALIRSVR